MNHLPILVRREFWEHRALLYTPVAIIGLLLVIAVFSLMFGTVEEGGFSLSLRDMLSQHASHLPSAVTFIAITVFWLIFMSTLALMAVFYLLDCLYDERKNRSILFWKSMPVSDTETVVSKLLVAMVACPLLAIAAAVVSFVLVTLIFSVVTLAPTGVVAHPIAVVQGVGAMLYGSLVQVLWFAPILGWCLLASAGAPRSPFLWAALLPAGVILSEAMVFDTRHFLELLEYRLVGVYELAFDNSGDDFSMFLRDGQIHTSGNTLPVSEWLTPGAFFLAPGTWLGLLVAAIFVAGAIWLRRYRPGV